MSMLEHMCRFAHWFWRFNKTLKLDYKLCNSKTLGEQPPWLWLPRLLSLLLGCGHPVSGKGMFLALLALCLPSY